ncbi:MAG TPA: hypothetical protein VK017_13445 [Sphingobacterium sp.]|nr:hypothetical protein [Sphingobacterium sp.]
MNKVIKKMGDAVQVVLLAPIKLPGKVRQVLQYAAVSLEILGMVVDKEENSAEKRKEVEHETAE